MPHGGKLRIEAENVDIDEHYARMNVEAKPGKYVSLWVTDTGLGIPDQNLSKIFDPFFTTKEHGKGTGLGLSTVAGIVRSHGGFISVYSEMGRGARFRVYLPAIEAAQAAQATSTARFANRRRRTDSGDRRRDRDT
jgi:signal transduction histidine kinase